MTTITIYLIIFIPLCVLATIGVIAIFIFLILLADLITMLVQEKRQYGIGRRKEDE